MPALILSPRKSCYYGATTCWPLIVASTSLNIKARNRSLIVLSETLTSASAAFEADAIHMHGGLRGDLRRGLAEAVGVRRRDVAA